MKKIIRLFVFFLLASLVTNKSFSQTSWTGNKNTNWNNTQNWTAGVPNSGTNVIIGDANFTGSNQPTVNASSSCSSITIGGAVAATLTLTKNLVVNGSFTINSNGTVTHPKSTLTVKGNWTNNGSYSATNNATKIIFGGISQLINGSSVTTFRDVTINAGSLVTLGSNLNVTGTSSTLDIKGIFDPGQSPTYTVISTVNFRVYNNGTIRVNAATFAANYNLSGTVTLSPGSNVGYSSTTVNQTVSSAYSYSTLIISGSGTKSLAANLPALNSSNASRGNIFVNSGTFNLGAYTANRGTSRTGGSLNVANGAFLKIGGTSNFPSNYNTNVLTLGSTVEYNGTAQTISAQTYGNLIFSSGSGSSVKTMPGSAFTVEGDFSSLQGSGTSVSYTAASNITFNGNINIGASTTFNGSSFSHIIGGNWINNGTFTGSSGTLTFNGPSSGISGSGTQNFNNLSFVASGISAASGTSLNVSGNISTSGAGQFTHGSGGLITMTGASKSITGTNIIFNDLTVSGSVTTNTSFTINGNLSVSGSLSASAGTIIMAGSSKTISGTGTIALSTLQVTGSITTASNFSISSLLDVSGTFSASTGTATFTGASVLSGTANLFNATINGTSLQLSATSILGIANNFTITSGTLNVTASLPNTVNFNGSGGQSVNAIAYNNLILSNGNTKTAAGNITVNGTFTISTSTTFAGGTYTHTLLRNWVNNGTFTPASSTVQFTGTNNATITGATTFNIITINKSASSTTITLLNNITVATVNMTSGKMLTGSNKITITTTRTGNGIILGTITRTHAFGIGTSYAFEGPNNTINFTLAVGVTSITVTVLIGNIADFPDNASVNREYNISITATMYSATLRLHYEDAELNGNDETAMGLWNNPSSWTSVGKSASNSTNNYVEQSGLMNIASRWTCSEIPGVVRWNGSISTDWNTAGNWTDVSGTASLPPGATDIVQIGTAAFTNQPTISTTVNIKGITFGSSQAATLTIGTGGSLTTSGNIGGNWTSNAVHTINAGNQNITVNGDLSLSNGVNNRSINLSIGTGTVAVLGSCIQKGDASLIFSGTGALNIGGDFAYTSGTFTPGSGTVTYNGTDQQTVAGVPYNNLTVDNTTGNASIPSGLSIAIAGNLSILAGQLEIDTTTIIVSGNVTISSGTTLDCNGVTINAAGNWTNNGTYLSTTGTLNINGSGAQNISAGTFNNLTINKTSGVANLTGNNSVAGNLSVQAGTLNLSTYTISRQSSGGSFSMSAGSTLQVGGANNFPSNYSVNTINATSTVLYDGTVAQSIAGITYGNISFSNGGSNAKTQLANMTVAGNLLINSGATFNSGGFSTGLSGNWTNAGTFTPSSGTVILNGTSKTVTGNTTFNNLTVNGAYTVVGSNMTYNGLLWVTTGASYISSAATTSVCNGDLTNNGTLVGNGTITFTGTSVQTIRLVNAILSASTGVVNFNGNVSPVLNSNSSPQFATLNINNTAGLNPTTGATVFVALNIGSGAILNAGNSTHNIYGSFTNAGTVTSTGTLNFVPVAPKTIALGSSGFSSDGIVNFGGTGQITITGTPDSINTVIISNTNVAGISPSSDWKIDSNFVVTENAIFNAGSHTYTINGNIESEGTLNGETSTFITTSDDAELSVGSESVFNHFTNTGFLTPQTDFNVAGNFTNNGTYDGSVGVLIMTGNANASIGGTTVPSPIAQLTIQKLSNAVVTQNVNLSELSFLNIFSGTLFTSTKTVTQDAGGGILVIENGATLKLGGTNSLPGFSGYALDTSSNVDYAGVATTQAVGNAANYGNLIISGTGNKNAYTALTVFGNLTVSAGVLNTNTNSVIHSVAGDFIMTGGTLSGTNSTYLLNGANDQQLTLLSNLIRLTVNKSGGVVNLGSSVTVSTLLTFTLGRIQTGSYAVIVPSGGAVSGAGQSTGWVIGNLQKNVATGSSVSRTFEVGGSIWYSPATVLFASVSTSGNLKVKATATDQPQVDYSGIDSTKSVNRYWSITNSGIVFTTATSTFNWVVSDVDPGANTANFKTASYNGSSWALNAVTSPLATSIKATGLTSFGDFAIGEAITQYVWTGGGYTSDWNSNSNWSGGVPTTNLNTLIPNGITGGKVYPILSSGIATVKDLTIESAASLTVADATLQISGTINNSGTFDVSNGSIEMNGSSSQGIPASAFLNNALKDLIISNSNVAGVSLGGALDVYGSLVYTGTGMKLNTNDNLTLKSTTTNTAWVGDMTGNTIKGKVSVERYISARKAWQFLSIPTNNISQTIKQAWQEGATTTSDNPAPGFGIQITGAGGTGAGFDIYTATASMKTYNSANDTWVGISSTNNPIKATTGYMTFIRGDRTANAYNSPATQTVLRTKGDLYTGDQAPIPVNANEFTAIGNPFASAIDMRYITKTGVKNFFYMWDPQLSGASGYGAYQTFSYSGGDYIVTPGGGSYAASGMPSNFIQSGQAFFVQGDVGGGSLTFKEDTKTTGSALISAPARLPQSQLRATLLGVNTDNSTYVTDGLLINYDDGYSNAVDDMDAIKLVNSSENLSVKAGNKLLVVERRHTINSQDTIFLNLANVKVQKYRFEINADELDKPGLTAFLEDTYLHTTTPLNLNGSTTIDFNIVNIPGSYAADRFRIVFTPSLVLPLSITSVKAYQKDKNIAVEWTVENESNMKQYDVEKSFDGNHYGTVNTVAANNAPTNSYSWLDKNAVEGYNYYRIRATDMNSKNEYSKVVKVNIQSKKTTPAIGVFPNPVTGNIITLRLKNLTNGIYSLQLLNASGQVIEVKSIQHVESVSAETFEIQHRLAAGKYDLKLTGNGVQLNTSVIKK